MIRRPPRSTLDRSSAASDVYKRQLLLGLADGFRETEDDTVANHREGGVVTKLDKTTLTLSLIHISEPTRPY